MVVASLLLCEEVLVVIVVVVFDVLFVLESCGLFNMIITLLLSRRAEDMM